MRLETHQRTIDIKKRSPEHLILPLLPPFAVNATNLLNASMLFNNSFE